MSKKLYLKIGAIITTVALTFCAIFGNHIHAVEVGNESGVEVSEQTPQTEANQEAVDVTGQNVTDAPMDENVDKALVQQEITSWKWVDPDQVLTDSTLLITNASAKVIVTKETLETMLPKAILAMVNGLEVEVPLSWDYNNYPTNGAYEGVYTINAIHKEYVLAKDVPPVFVSVQFESNQISTMAVNNPKYQVPGVSPNGTRIQLFDYWISANRHDNSDANIGLKEEGINKDHTLNFLSIYDQSNLAKHDRWTREGGSPRFGLVKNQLVNGYPMLQKNPYSSTKTNQYYTDLNGDKKMATGVTQDESLAYLFNPSITNIGKQSFRNVKNLLQIDNHGYYYYDSDKNFAHFNENTNAFELYNKASAGFFPFDTPNEVFNESNQQLQPNGISTESGSLNHYLGVHMSTKFVHQKNGYVNGNKDKPVTYQFSGDDDVWVFIDGVLVADLGGIHNKVSLDIDFSTGNIRIYGSYKGTAVNYETSTLKDKFKAANASLNKFNSDNNTFKNDTFHKLDFFYLERGHNVSNMSLKFNLVTIPTSELIKSDQFGSAVEGAEFAIYNADDVNGTLVQKELINGNIKTNKDGKFVLVDQEGNIISLKELYIEYGYRHLIVRETKAPPGYRKIKKDVHLDLVLRNNSVVVVNRNKYETGVYASSKALATASDTFSVFKETGKEPLNNYTIETGNGTLFAVVMQLKGNIDTPQDWYPLSGNELTGWHVESGHTYDDILNAAKKNPYIFKLSASGSYQAEVANLPGDILSYYYLQPQGNVDKSQVKYTVAYFWTPKTLETAKASEVYRVNSKTFDRDFSVKLLVPNIKNMIMVQKVDEVRNPIKVGNDPTKKATFELYKEHQVKVNADGSGTVLANQVPYDQMTTHDLVKSEHNVNMDAALIFPTKGKVLENGIYYIREAKAPQGYLASSQFIKVIVNNDGVFADAGVKDDGIRVKLESGRIVKSLLQVTNGDVNGTLADIMVQLNAGDSITNLKPTNHKVYTSFNDLYLTSQTSLEYLIKDIPSSCKDSNRHWKYGLMSDVGFSDLQFKQWITRQSDNNIDPPTGIEQKEDLKGMDVSHLLSELVVVEVQNEKDPNKPDATDLHIKKVVEPANVVDPNKEFAFTLELSHENDGSGNVYNILFSEKVNDQRRPNAIKNALANIRITKNTISQTSSLIEQDLGNKKYYYTDKVWNYTEYYGYTYSYNFTLKPNEELVITGLPEGTKYTITEQMTGNEYKTNIKELNSFVSNKVIQSVDQTTINGQLAIETKDSRLEDYILVTNTLNQIPFNFEFTKVGKELDSNGQPIGLVNAEFDLYELTCTDSTHKHDQLIDVTNPNACWKKVNTQSIASDQNGKVILKNVVAGKTYRFVETKAPEGYVLPNGQWTIVFNEQQVPTITAIGNPPAFEKGTNGYKLYNHKPNELPLTGGRTNKLYGLLGFSVMLLGIFLAIKAYHKKLNLNDM